MAALGETPQITLQLALTAHLGFFFLSLWNFSSDDISGLRQSSYFMLVQLMYHNNERKIPTISTLKTAVLVKNTDNKQDFQSSSKKAVSYLM